MDEAQAEREAIARDQQSVIAEEDSSEGVIGIIIERDSPTVMGRVVRMNLSGRIVMRSAMDTVHTRTVTFAGERIIAIAGQNAGNGAVRLVEINPANLEMARQGDDDLLAGSLLWVNGSDLYAITFDIENSHCYLGRFNTNLALQAKSSVRINPNASVSIQQGRLLTQREDGQALILNPANLTEVR